MDAPHHRERSRDRRSSHRRNRIKDVLESRKTVEYSRTSREKWISVGDSETKAVAASAASTARARRARRKNTGMAAVPINAGKKRSPASESLMFSSGLSAA